MPCKMTARHQAPHMDVASFHGTRIVESLGFTWAVRGARCCALGPVLSPRCNLRAPVDTDRGQLARHDAGNGITASPEAVCNEPLGL
jgi:hypothetical protein